MILETTGVGGQSVPAAHGDLMLPTVLVDRAFRIRSANRAFCNLLGLSPSVSDGLPFFRLHGGRWDRPALRRLIEGALAGQEIVEETVPLDVPQIGQCLVRLEAHRVSPGGFVELVSVAVLECRPYRELLRESRRDEWGDVDAADGSEPVAGRLAAAYRDLGAALAVILGSAQFLAGHDDPTVRDDAANIADAAETLRRLLRDAVAEARRSEEGEEEGAADMASAAPGLRLYKAA